MSVCKFIIAGLSASCPPPQQAQCRTCARSQWALRDLNRQRQISVGSAGPQQRVPDVIECHKERQIECPIATRHYLWVVLSQPLVSSPRFETQCGVVAWVRNGLMLIDAKACRLWFEMVWNFNPKCWQAACSAWWSVEFILVVWHVTCFHTAINSFWFRFGRIVFLIRLFGRPLCRGFPTAFLAIDVAHCGPIATIALAAFAPTSYWRPRHKKNLPPQNAAMGFLLFGLPLKHRG